jgi:hypothetical protein
VFKPHINPTSLKLAESRRNNSSSSRKCLLKQVEEKKVIRVASMREVKLKT